jgi:hypothetical protein
LSDRPVAGDGTVTPDVGEAWRSILLRRPTWRAEAELRAEYGAGGRPDDRIAALGPAEPGRVQIDLAEVDARPADGDVADALLAVEARDGSAIPLSSALASIPVYWLIARRYRRRG